MKMKTLTAMEVRKHFGAVIDEVRMKSETIILERAGKQVAVIQPISSLNSEKGSHRTHESKLDALAHLAGLESDSPRAADIDAWLESERAGWDERS
jgi:antitoxin (DNA-binding transcriptional repressor) of toxin-antitoxin stability system